MNYFESFPKINYPYLGKLVIDGTTTSMIETVDLTVRFKFIDAVLDDPLAYYSYYWKNGTRPDLLAESYYGDSRLAWLVMMSAQVFDWIYDLPLDDELFDEYLKTKYDVESSNILATTNHHFETGAGYIIDELTYSTYVDSNKRTVSIYEYESLANEKRRNIKLISVAYLPIILKEFDTMNRSIKSSRAASGSY